LALTLSLPAASRGRHRRGHERACTAGVRAPRRASANGDGRRAGGSGARAPRSFQAMVPFAAPPASAGLALVVVLLAVVMGANVGW